jgi:hypothetical protein
MEEPATDPTTTTARRRGGVHVRRSAPLVAVVVGLAVFLAACGGGSDPGSAKSGQGSSTSTSSASASSGSSGSSQTGAVAFAQCVRAHGVPDFPDPQNGHFLISGADENNPNFQSATQACEHLLPSGSATNGGGSGSNSSAELAFAHCMQTHGVPSFPDPSSNGALGIPQGVDANSPQFQSAFSACSSLLPNNGAGLGG